MKKSNRAIFKYLSIFILLNMILFTSMKGLQSLGFEVKNINATWIILGGILIQFLIFLLPLKILSIKKDELGFKKLNLKKTLKSILSTYLLLFGINLTIFIFKLNEILPGLGQQDDMISDLVQNNLDFYLLMISVCLVAPILEEIIFRGYIYEKFKQNYSTLKSSILTSIGFSFLHLQFNVFLGMFIISMLLHKVKEDTQSTFGPIIFHSINNTIAFWVLMN